MTEEEKELPPDDDATHMEAAQEIWTPPESLDPNTQRMAWLLFLEAWKAWIPYCIDTREHPSGAKFHAGVTYKTCLETAKTVRQLETEVGGS